MTANSLSELKSQIDTALSGFLPTHSAIAPAILEAMRHGVLGGGKRLRPMLACASAEACGGSWQGALSAGCATEFIHAYSLIHDDLPAMDDDELRHGLPSTHIAFGEAKEHEEIVKSFLSFSSSDSKTSYETSVIHSILYGALPPETKISTSPSLEPGQDRSINFVSISNIFSG